jgi:hypothetical protein
MEDTLTPREAVEADLGEHGERQVERHLPRNARQRSGDASSRTWHIQDIFWPWLSGRCA